MGISLSAFPKENRLFNQALAKVLSISRSEIIAWIPPKRKRTGKRSSDSPCVSVPSTDDNRVPQLPLLGLGKPRIFPRLSLQKIVLNRRTIKA